MWLKGSEALHLENKSLKKKLEAAGRENRELKQSLYELTAKHGAAMLQLGRMEASEVMAQQSAPLQPSCMTRSQSCSQQLRLRRHPLRRPTGGWRRQRRRRRAGGGVAQMRRAGRP